MGANMNKYRIEFLINDRLNVIKIDADYYCKEDDFISFFKDREDGGEDEVLLLKTEYLVTITKI